MDWNAKEYNRHAFYVSKYGEELIDILRPKKGEYILDLGCGDGTLARKIGDLGARMHCVDYSATMIAEARKKGIASTVLDAHALSFDKIFDAVFSNAAMHWMKDPQQILRNVLRALKPGGRFVAEFGAQGNLLTVTQAVATVLRRYDLEYEEYNPWFFPAKDEYHALLQESGFGVTAISTFERPTVLPYDFVRWFQLFAEPFLVDVPEEAHNRFCNEVAEELRPVLCDAHNKWTIDYVRIRIVAHNP